MGVQKGKIEYAWENYLWTAANPLSVFEESRKIIDLFKLSNPTFNFIIVFFLHMQRNA